MPSESKGTRLKRMREARDLTQEDVAKALGVSKQTIHKYEKDIVTNIPSDKIDIMAKLYRVSPAEIMGWDVGSVRTTTTMTFDGDSPMHALTQAYLRHPKAVQDEILVRLDRLDVTFSKNVSKLLMDSGDVNGFMQKTGLDFPRVGKLMQGETVWTTPEEAERIAAYFGTDVVKLFFESEVSTAPPKTIASTSAPTEDPVTNAFAVNLENLPKPVANLLAKALNSELKYHVNTYRVLVALAKYLSEEGSDPTSEKTEKALDIIRNPNFTKYLNKALHKFEQENLRVVELDTAAYAIAEEIYTKASIFQILYVDTDHPARNLKTLLERKLGLS